MWYGLLHWVGFEDFGVWGLWVSSYRVFYVCLDFRIVGLGCMFGQCLRLSL